MRDVPPSEETANALGEKRLEFQELPARVEELEQKMRTSVDPEAIRGFQTQLRELEREKEVQEIALKSVAVEAEQAYLQLYREQLAEGLAEAAAAKEAQRVSEEAFKAAEAALESAVGRKAKADHDVAASRRQIEQREIAIANIRNGNLAVA